VAKTFLNGVNEVLTRVNVIAGNAGLLTSFTNSALQHNIDVTKQVINEGIEELFTASHKSLPTEQKESTIVLLTGIREYSLATDLITLLWPMIDRVNNQYIWEYTEGYNQLLLLDPEQDDTGLPICAVISPINGKLRLDRSPTSFENGNTYYYQYEKNLVLTTETDPMQFNDQVFRAMVPAWVQLYKREMRNEFDQGLYAQGIGRASRSITELKQRTDYSPRG
jgi:hypothetical protein